MFQSIDGIKEERDLPEVKKDLSEPDIQQVLVQQQPQKPHCLHW